MTQGGSSTAGLASFLLATQRVCLRMWHVFACATCKCTASTYAMRACNDWIFMISVCVDAMGGDEKPEVVLQGIELSLIHI